MSLSCKSAIGCVDSHVPVVPVRASYINLYKWPESDAEFVKTVAQKRDDLGTIRRTDRSSPVVVDSFSCRQMYLRSYTFSKRETMPQKTMRCLSRVREKASELPFIHRRNESVGSVSVASSYVDSERNKSENKKRNKKNKNKKKCVAIKKLVSSIFHRILSCTSQVDVVNGNGTKSTAKGW